MTYEFTRRRRRFEGSSFALRIVDGRISFRARSRTIIVVCLILGLVLGIGIISLVSGKYAVSASQAISALMGGGDEFTRMIVTEWRLPRVLIAFTLGGALGVSGAIFQSLTRNPLGSPDVIGFSAGSYTGALVVILLLSGGYYQTAIGAVIGGIVTTLAVYLLAYRRGVQGFRLIIVGIGIAAMLGAFNSWMIKQADLNVALSAAFRGAGSLNGLGYEQAFPIMLTLSLTVPFIAILSRPMRQLELGDDAAQAAGVNATRVRLSLIMLGVTLTAIATAAAGPISFVALAAPQIARRLSRSAGVALVPACLTGASLLMVADWAAQHALGVQLPVGVMTVSIGGLYFLWLLIREGYK
ncbi:FecCD family ABC transporter permease (plasmid) [Agrobacterium rosae]|uniref:FecCD family ABC transporter permease n=1 Tax=Agrobacterium rosae TaxID=1972867 RepID=UPI002A0B3F1E|nr:iron chelate uptake ABC transporter family permease subunit [Agrobacterium rosae]MDX8316443.1 iron chelate uptake ABC transporter family permease subunit [Agrobacterium rosae]